MAFEIDYDGLELAISSGRTDGSFYFDRESGQVLPVGEFERESASNCVTLEEIDEPSVRLAWCQMWENGTVGDGVADADVADVQQRVDEYLARFLIVPAMTSGEAYEDMEDFAETLEDDHLHNLLVTALHGRGAFRRFKNVLMDYPAERQRWFDFHDTRMRQRVEDWLRDKGFDVKD